MQTKNGLSFNCAESVMLEVNEHLSMPAFNSSCMRIGSVLGGGLAGCGEVCGAVSGAAACLGILYGTEGTESPDDFKNKRIIVRDLTKQLIEEFIKSWGTVCCRDLKAMDRGEMKSVGESRLNLEAKERCDEYVQWAVRKLLTLSQSCT